MNVIITGGRDYVLTQADYQFLEHAVAMLRAKAIFTNGLLGVSAQVESWAQRRGIPVHRVTANFMHDGPATPEERNTSLVPLAKAVIAFPGDSVSDDLIEKARKARRSIHESPSRQLAKPSFVEAMLRQRANPGTRPKLKP